MQWAGMGPSPLRNLNLCLVVVFYLISLDDPVGATSHGCPDVSSFLHRFRNLLVQQFSPVGIDNDQIFLVAKTLFLVGCIWQ